ncbi:MAG TPA: hypothetical protein VL334_11380 [Anaerolineae bacterium]|nr:hypothetical protein [Anaerolineae bacterium]
MAAKIRFYLDENIPVAVSTQLKRRGIEAVTVRNLELLAAFYQPEEMTNRVEYL